MSQEQRRPTASRCSYRIERRMRRFLHVPISVTPGTAYSHHLPGQGASEALSTGVPKDYLGSDLRLDSCANSRLAARAPWIAQECAMVFQ